MKCKLKTKRKNIRVGISDYDLGIFIHESMFTTFDISTGKVTVKSYFAFLVGGGMEGRMSETARIFVKSILNGTISIYWKLCGLINFYSLRKITDKSGSLEFLIFILLIFRGVYK